MCINKSRIVWNKGLTKETDERVKKYVEKLKNYVPSKEKNKKHSEFMKGKKYRLGHKHSEKTKIKMRESAKRRVMPKMR